MLLDRFASPLWGLLCGAALFVLLLPSAAHGQLQDVSDRRVQVHISGSPAYPFSTSDFSVAYQNGASVSVAGGVTLKPDWEIALEGSYSRFRLDESGYATSINGSQEADFEGQMAVYSGTITLKRLIYTEGRVVPYFASGVGVYHLDEDDVELIVGDRSFLSSRRQNRSLVGIHVGFGVAARVTDWLSLFAEPRYTATASFSDTKAPTIDYASARIGLIAAPW